MNIDESYKIMLQENLREYNEKQFVKKQSPRIQFVLTHVVYSAWCVATKQAKRTAFLIDMLYFIKSEVN